MNIILKKTKEFFSPLLQKREEGNVVDLMAGILVMILLFAMILAMIIYGSLVEKRLAIDNTVKEYLYIAEQYGHLCNGVDGFKSSVCRDYCSELEQTLINTHGCTEAKVEPDTTVKQVAYGNQVRVHVTVKFPNPLYEQFSQEEKGDGMFTLLGIQPVLEYSVSYDATSRW